jgi:hypothetical protein
LGEIFAVEVKMIVVKSFKYSPFSFKKASGIYPLVQNGEESSVKTPSPAPPATPGCPKRIAQREVIVAINTKPGSVTVPEEWDDAQLTLLTAISVFGDSTCPLFISKLKTFEKALLAAQKLYEAMITQFGQLHEHLSQKFFSLTGLT